MWKDCGKYWEHSAPQGSEDWLKARKGIITSSNSGALAGKSSFKTAAEVGPIIAGVKVEEFSEKSIGFMAHGHKYEGTARNLFATQHKVKIVERGLCISKEDPTIGASVDGDILGTDGCIEIKCPQKMYRGLQTYIDNINSGWKPEENYYSHIFPTHLVQCMQACFVLKKKYCVYIVYCVDTQQLFTQKVNFCQKYWDEHYALLKKNYNLYVLPYLS